MRILQPGREEKTVLTFFIQLMSLFSGNKRPDSFSPSYSSILTIKFFCFKRFRCMVHKR